MHLIHAVSETGGPYRHIQGRIQDLGARGGGGGEVKAARGTPTPARGYGGAL